MNSEIQDYILTFSLETQEKLYQVYETILSVSTDIEPCIAYKMPAFKYKGKPVVYFAGYKNHIGFYATPTGHEAFKNELSAYKEGKGSVQFPLNKEIPFDLILRISTFRLEEVKSKFQKK